LADLGAPRRGDGLVGDSVAVVVDVVADLTPGARDAAVAGVADSVAVEVLLCGIGVLRTEVGSVADAVTVGVRVAAARASLEARADASRVADVLGARVSVNALVRSDALLSRGHAAPGFAVVAVAALVRRSAQRETIGSAGAAAAATVDPGLGHASALAVAGAWW